MNREDIVAFIGDMIEKITATDITALKLEMEGCKLTLERTVANASAPTAAAPVQVNTTMVELAPAATAVQADDHMYTVTSPIVGTFYAAPEPETPDFVTVGSRVAKGDVLCIMEAMKMMNEIEAERSGTVTEILVKNGQLVEFGQPLFVILPEEAHA